jgi:hypothetical protein
VYAIVLSTILFFETELLVTTHEQVLFAWIINHQPAVLLSQNEPATSNQPAVLFFQKKPAPAISHQPTEQAACGLHARCFFNLL